MQQLNCNASATYVFLAISRIAAAAGLLGGLLFDLTLVQTI